MVPYKVAYHRPSSVAEALELMAKHGDECKILAGGHSLVPIMKLRLADPENLIDITGIENLKGIRDNEKSITVGACCTHADIANSAVMQEHAPMMTTAAKSIGDIQVRNFGTIGGSIAHADPAADWPAVLLAADANVVLQSTSGTREVDIDQYFKGLFTTALEENEIITAIRIPKTAGNKNSTYVKFPQPASRFALVGCAVAIAMDGSSVGSARVAFNGVSGTSFRDTTIENALKGQALNEGTITAATANTADGVSVLDDHFAKPKYRKHLAGVYARRALSALA